MQTKLPRICSVATVAVNVAGKWVKGQMAAPLPDTRVSVVWVDTEHGRLQVPAAQVVRVGGAECQ